MFVGLDLDEMLVGLGRRDGATCLVPWLVQVSVVVF